MRSKEIFTGIKEELSSVSPLNVILTLGFIRLVWRGSAFFCQPDELLSQLHGAAKNYMDVLLHKSSEKEIANKLVEKIPDEEISDAATKLHGAVRTSKFQKSVMKCKKPHRVIFEDLQQIVSSYERRFNQ